MTTDIPKYLIPPSYLMVEPTWRCNLDCIMCPRNICGYSMGKKPDMTYEQFEYILDEVQPKPGSKVNYAACGEPFVNPDIFDMFNLCSKRRLGIMLTTNMIMLNRKNIDRLPKDIPIAMHTSIDSPIPSKYKEIRGIDLDYFLNNAKLLRKMRPDIELTLQPLLLKETIDDMEKIIPIARKLVAALMPLYPIVFSSESEARYSIWDVPNYKEKIINLLNLANHFGVPTFLKVFEPKRKPCALPWFGPLITVKGEIFPCCWVYQARNYNHTPDYWDEYYKGTKVAMPQGEYIVGNIFKDNFNDVWKGEVMCKLRKDVRQYEKEITNGFDFLAARQSYVHKDRFDYCKLCLELWGQAC